MIDIQTFLLALGIGNVSFAVLVALYNHRAAPNAAVRLWMWARLGLGAAQLLGGMRSQPEPGPLALLEAAGWVLSIALEVAAYCVFFGFRRWQRVLYPLAALVFALVLAAARAGASYAQLTALVAVIVALSTAALAVILLRPHQASVSLLQQVIGLNGAVFALAIGLWVFTGLMQGDTASFPPGPVQAFVYLAGYLLMIVNGFGFVLLCKQKDDGEMVRLATTDFLTGLANRRAFFEQAERARLLTARLHKPIALLMLDIDHFKQINDRFGHATGDEALVVFAETARAVLREHDIMGRLGGEEFALALPGTDLEGAVHAAERLREAVTEAPIITSGNPYTMTVSIGVVVVEPNEELTAALARADRALYTAKSAGRNRVEIGAPVRRRA